MEDKQTMVMVRPFSNGTQYGDWLARNCEECRKGIDNVGGPGDWPVCEIEAALTQAYLGSGDVLPEIAERMGYVQGRVNFIWNCTELDAGPPPAKDGKVLVSYACERDGLVFSPWMCLENSIATVRTAAADDWQPRKRPAALMAEIHAAGHAPIEPKAILRTVARNYRDMVLFTTGRVEMGLHLDWWCQFWEAGLELALSKHGRGVFVVLAGGRVVGAVMGDDYAHQSAYQIVHSFRQEVQA